MLELTKLMFVATNPIPVKRACNYLGIGENELRRPLVPMSEENEKKLINTMLNFEKNIM